MIERMKSVIDALNLVEVRGKNNLDLLCSSIITLEMLLNSVQQQESAPEIDMGVNLDGN